MEKMRKWLGDLDMTKKLLVSPFVAVLFLLIFGVVSYAAFFKQKAALDDIFNNRFSHFQAAADILIDLKQIQTGITDLVGIMDQDQKSTAHKEQTGPKKEGYDEGASGGEYDVSAGAMQTGAIDEARNDELATMKRMEATIQEVGRSSTLSAEEKTGFAAAQQKIAAYTEMINRVVDTMEKDSRSAQAMILDVENSYKDMDNDIHKLLDLERNLGKHRYASAALTFKMALTVTLIVFAAALILPFGISLLMKSVILSPIRRTVEIIESISQGDLTQRIDIDSSDEIGEMAKHFNVHADKLRQVISQVAESSDRVSSSVHTLELSSDTMQSDVREVTGRVSDTATASAEMSQTASEISRNCMIAAKSSQEASSSAQSGKKTVERTVDMMNRIGERVTHAASIIKKLGARSDEIGSIVGLINDVADQTNLLALNAAIEAARAGEHGRGFAVVADEVKKLAERTASGTKEIGDTIRAMQLETKEAVASMEESVSEVGMGSREAAKSGQALETCFNRSLL
jgi:methyl-accepting chemotaxis protein